MSEAKRIWIVEVGEPLPIDPGTPKRMRAALLSEQCARRGHEVIWWTSSFDHYRKARRPVGRHRIEGPGWHYNIEVLPALGYQRHVSLRRLRDHRYTARSLKTIGALQPRPDVICAGLPTLDLAVASSDLCDHFDVPLVTDVQDLWPDIFYREAPSVLRPLVRLAVWPLERQANKACIHAAALIGVCPDFLAWGLRRARRPKRLLDTVFSLATDPIELSEADNHVAEQHWRALGVTPTDTIVTFVGSFTKQFSFDAVCDVVENWSRSRPAVKFVLCGEGPLRQDIIDRFSSRTNVVLPGWTNAREASWLMRTSKVGLAPYRPSPDFEANYSNKVIEYLGMGLPIVTSLERGPTAELLVNRSAGSSYRHDSSSSLDAALAAFIDDRAAQASASRNARATFKADFTADNVYGRYAELLATIANGG
jgi:glycosyltransferase involved in cell wall biosynthesis